MKPMGEIIKEERKRAGLTQEELGKMLGVQKNAVCKWEKGRTLHIGQDKLYLMSQIFDCTPQYLMGFDASSETYDLQIKNDTVAKVVAMANDMDSRRQRMLLTYAKFLQAEKSKRIGSDEE